MVDSWGLQAVPLFFWRGSYELPVEGGRTAALPALSTTQASLPPSLSSRPRRFLYSQYLPLLEDQDL